MNYITLQPIMFEDKSIRRTSDGRVSVFDLIRVVGGQKDPYEVWEFIKNKYPDVSEFTLNIKFPGRGQKETPVVDKTGALQIIGILPGEAGKKYRQEAAELVLEWYEHPEELAVKAFDRIENPAIIRKTKSRIDGMVSRKLETRIFADTGLVTEGKQYAELTNATYTNLLGGDCKSLKKQRGLSEKESLRDSMDDVELIALSLAEALSTREIEKEKPTDFEGLKGIVSSTARKIAIAIN